MMLGSLSRARWVRLEPLLDAALELEAEQRSAYLAKACGSDAALRGEIDALLAACALGDSILTNPAAITFAPLLGDVERRPPAIIGDRYRIVREIGRGGMGVVYLADDQKHGRQVAVKTLHADVARLIGRERFAREIDIAAGLSHPHILPLHDSGEMVADDDAESSLYFITPFVAGESLRARLSREGALPLADAVRLAREIALALDYAHRRGVVHLDIKPENILLHEGHAVVADFGIARAVARPDEVRLAPEAARLGTPAYMSPEQALGEADLDGRSDIYSLGCVLSEMLTGERPAKARHVASREVAALVARATSPARGDRYATGRALADALGDIGGSRKRRRWSVAVAAIATVAVGVVAALAWRSNRTVPLNADLVAVAPFDVATPSLALWKQGLVDVMSRSLDGAGALRSVPASVVVRAWQGRSDARSAQALGRATGARLVLVGGLFAAGDSVRATATLLDVQTGRTVAELDERDVPERIDRLADSLTLSVLRELRRTRRTDMANATSSPTTSLAALKTYLQGEQFYRAAHWDSAQAHFEHALSLDTAFALAYHRLAAVRRWREPGARPDSIAYELMRRTSRFPRGLGPRERLLATIDSLSAETYFAWQNLVRHTATGHETALFDRLCLTLVEAQRQYPDDPEFAFLHAEVRAEYDRHVMVGEIDDRGMLGRYDRAIELDSGFAPAYVKPIALAAYLDGAERARRYTRAYLARTPAVPASHLIRVADGLLAPRSTGLDVASLVDSLSPEALCDATALMRHAPDSAETVVQLARALARRFAEPNGWRRGYDCTVREVVNGLQFRGRLRDAERMAAIANPSQRLDVVYHMARFGVMSRDSARMVVRRLAPNPQVTLTRLFAWWATDGDTTALQKQLAEPDVPRAARRSRQVDAAMRATIATGQAYLALARRDTADALRLFLASGDSVQECRSENRVAVVQLLTASGRHDDAGARLRRRWPGTTACSNGADDVVWTMERARTFDRLGRREEAVASYDFVVRAWRNADAELQPWVREASAAIARLGAGAKARSTLAAVESRPGS